MTSRLSHDIAKLAEARQWRVHDQGAVKELTMVIGFAHLAEM
jgi:hypothetical protein